MQTPIPKRRGCFARIVRWILFLFVFLIAVVALMNFLTTPRERRPAATPVVVGVTQTALPWYVGGTLHDKSVADWQEASDADKLATAADWVVSGLKIDVAKYSDAELKILATSMEDCVDQLSQPLIKNNQITTTVVSVAALCAITMEKELPLQRK